MKVLVVFNGEDREGKVSVVSPVRDTVCVYLPRWLRHGCTHLLVIPLRQGEVKLLKKSYIEVRFVEH